MQLAKHELLQILPLAPLQGKENVLEKQTCLLINTFQWSSDAENQVGWWFGLCILNVLERQLPGERHWLMVDAVGVSSSKPFLCSNTIIVVSRKWQFIIQRPSMFTRSFVNVPLSLYEVLQDYEKTQDKKWNWHWKYQTAMNPGAQWLNIGGFICINTIWIENHGH